MVGFCILFPMLFLYCVVFVFSSTFHEEDHYSVALAHPEDRPHEFLLTKDAFSLSFEGMLLPASSHPDNNMHH